MSIVKVLLFAAFIASVCAQFNSPLESAMTALQSPLQGEAQQQAPVNGEVQQRPCDENAPANKSSRPRFGLLSPSG